MLVGIGDVMEEFDVGRICVRLSVRIVLSRMNWCVVTREADWYLSPVLARS